MNIAMFTDSYTPYISGVVRSIQRFSRGLTALGHNVYIFAPQYPYQDLTDDDEQDAAKVFRFHSFPAPTCPSYALPIPISLKADRLIRTLGIDLIHTHSPFITGQWGAILARRHSIPLVFTHHTRYQEYSHYVPGPKRLTQQMITSYLKRYFRHCDHLITPTESIKQYLLELYQIHKPITIVPTGIDLAKYEGADPEWLFNNYQIPKHKQIMLYVGRLSQEKNPRLILEAFLQLNQLIPELHLVFVGDGPEKKSLIKTAAAHGLAQKVTFTGALNAAEVIHCYSGADLFVFSSTTETQGLVLIEAMAGGVPVVAVKATGSIESVIHGYNGFLTDNSAADLAAKAQLILTNHILQKQMQSNALKTAQQYSIENTSRQLVEVYHQTLTQAKVG
jgi:glycosyltransferase involved in cell wall biosynthesis